MAEAIRGGRGILDFRFWIFDCSRPLPSVLVPLKHS
jgi:hypothetical protein